MKKNVFIGLLVIISIFVFVMTGCKLDESDIVSKKEFLYKNESSYTIVVTIFGENLSPNNFELESGAEQKIKGKSEDDFFLFSIYWVRKDTGFQTGVTYSEKWDNIRTGWFKNN